MTHFVNSGKDAFANALAGAKAVHDNDKADQKAVDSAMLELVYRTADH